jgi:hypothetical protein
MKAGRPRYHVRAKWITLDSPKGREHYELDAKGHLVHKNFLPDPHPAFFDRKRFARPPHGATPVQKNMPPPPPTAAEPTSHRVDLKSEIQEIFFESFDEDGFPFQD